MNPHRVGRAHGVGLACALASVAVLGVSVVVLGVLTPGYSPSSDTISRLGSPGQPHALAARATVVSYGLLVIAGSLPLARLAPCRPRLLAGLVGLYGAAAVVAGLAPKHVPATSPTLGSEVHVMATVVGGTAVIGAMVVVARYAPRASDRRTGAAVAGLTMLGTIVFGLTWGSDVYGLVERAVVAVAALWVVTLMWRGPRLRPRPASARPPPTG